MIGEDECDGLVVRHSCHDRKRSADTGEDGTETPSSATTDNLSRAKRLFHRSAQVRVVGRSAERAFVQRFWTESMDSEDKAKVLYICGNPGTGKTALIREMLPELVAERAERKIMLMEANCMMQDDPREVFTLLAGQLGLINSKKGRGRLGWEEMIEHIGDHLKQISGPSAHSVLVLDEIDQIAMKDAKLLELLFQLPYREGVKMSLIGIANALDLSIRYFTSPPDQVTVLNFAPYSVEDISRILIARLELVNQQNSCAEVTRGKRTKRSLPSTPYIIAPTAIEICARKVSSVGDLRQALEIMREGISQAQREEAMTVEIRHLMAAMERVFGATVRTSSRHAQMVAELNLHQKLLLATLHRTLRTASSTKPTVQLLFERYTVAVREHRIIDAVGRSEFNDLISNSEAMGILALVAPGKRVKSLGATQSDTRIVLTIPAEDVAAGLSSNPVLASLL